MLIKISIHEEYIAIIYAQELNKKGANHPRQKLIELKGEKKKNTIILENLNTPLTFIDRPLQKKIK